MSDIAFPSRIIKRVRNSVPHFSPRFINSSLEFDPESNIFVSLFNDKTKQSRAYEIIFSVIARGSFPLDTIHLMNQIFLLYLLLQ